MILDTCSLLWLASDQTRLSDEARRIIRDASGELFISSITAFEIAIKHIKGKLVLPCEPMAWLNRAFEHHGIRELPVNSEIAVLSTALPALHNDPADRIIIATAIKYNMSIITPDKLIMQYDVGVKW